MSEEPEKITALNTLFDAGLTFADCVEAWAKRHAGEDDALIAKAHADCDCDELEIEEQGITSRAGGESGAWVMAWVWIEDEE